MRKPALFLGDDPTSRAWQRRYGNALALWFEVHEPSDPDYAAAAARRGLTLGQGPTGHDGARVLRAADLLVLILRAVQGGPAAD
ncbi:MAG TPA: hypothetical protein VHH11_13785 [Gammaproteobacteria bacterium]|nr:hypothetical protein [Gammaproteobacteria bacterium]